MQYPREYLPIINDAIYKVYGDYEPDLIRHNEKLSFNIEDKDMSTDKRDRLIKKASENISRHKIIPNGIKLVACEIEVLEELCKEK